MSYALGQRFRAEGPDDAGDRVPVEPLVRAVPVLDGPHEGHPVPVDETGEENLFEVMK